MSDCLEPRPCDATVSAWTRLIRAQRCTLAGVERALREADLPPLEWYDVLLELERDGSARPRDLQDRLLLAQYNLSRLLDRMQAAGAIERGTCKEDARGQVVCVTASGKRLRQKMWPVYSAAIEQAIGSRLTSPQARRLSELLGRLSNCG